MRIFAGIVVASLALACSASAGQVVEFCGSFDNHAAFALNPPNATGSITCPGITGLGTLTSFSTQVLLFADYSAGSPSFPTDSVVTDYQSTVSGFTQTWLEPSGQTNSNAPAACFNGSCVAAPPPAGFNNYFIQNTTETQVAAASSFAVNWINATGGSALDGITTLGSVNDGTGVVWVVYNYQVAGTTPEPVTMVLFGSGLIALSVIGRKKFARK